jgi:uncharacterized membrane protein YkvA (DUF1232 family)
MTRGERLPEAGGTGRRRQAVRFLKAAILLLPRIVQLLYRLMRDPRVSKADKVLLGALITYVASPIDVIPDFIPLAGQVDDLFAVAVVLLRLVANSGAEVLEEHWAGPPDLLPWIQRVAQVSRVFLPDRVAQTVATKFEGY